MRFLFLTLCMSLWLLSCKENGKATTAAASNAPALTLKDTEAVLKMMRKANQTQLDSVANFYVQMDDGYQIFSVKDSTGKSYHIESRVTNQVVPGVERKIYRGNSFEIWNRGGFASLSDADIQAIKPAFQFLGTAIVDSSECYKLGLDKEKLFTTEAGKRLFDDNSTEGANQIVVYVHPKYGLITRMVGKVSEQKKVSMTWRKWVKFRTMYFPQIRSITESGGDVKITPEIEAQVASINQEMQNYLRQIDGGEMTDIPPDQLARMREGVVKTLADNKRKLEQLRKGFSEENIYISNVRINKGYAPELF